MDVRPFNAVRVVIALLLVSRSAVHAQVIQPPPPAATPSQGRTTLLQALERTLATQPQLRIQEQQVEASRALKQQITGQFDLTLGSSFSQAHTYSPLTLFEREQALAAGIDVKSLSNNLSTFNFGATKLLRNGISVSPQYQTVRTTDNVTTGGTNISHINMQVTVPLLRGRGTEVVTAWENAAIIEIDATLLDLNQATSDLFAATATAYWNALAADKAVEVARMSEGRGRAYVENVQALTTAGRLPTNEINQVSANLASRTADRIAAEQDVIAAQMQLALASGVAADQLSATGHPSDEFPPGELLPEIDADATVRYVQAALARRADYLAARKRLAEARLLAEAARNQTKPQFNLALNAGTAGLAEGTTPRQFVSSSHRSIQGLDATVGFVYSFPVGNDVALGRLRQAQAVLQQAELREADLARTIAGSVVVALNGIQNAALQLEKARESVQAFQNALDGEREKFRLGINSLVDVLTLEDRLTAAMTNEVSAARGYALAVVRFRSATGTIVQPDQPVRAASSDVFFRIP